MTDRAAPAPSAADRYRGFLLGTAALVVLGSLVELWLIGHTEEWLQWVPFGLCALGLAAISAVRFMPSRGALAAGRVAFAVVAAGGLLGVYQHFAHNLAFEREIRPGAATADLLAEAVRGASPLLASGVLLLAAALGFAATLWREAD